VRTIRRGKTFCPYHELVLANAAEDLRAEVARLVEFRARSAAPPKTPAHQIDFEFMTPKQRQKIATAARARWAKQRAEARIKQNGAELKSAPRNQEIPTTTPHPLAGKSFTIEVEHSQLRGSETNPRKEFDEEGLRELADSFKTQGQLQACLVRVDPKWIAKELKTANSGAKVTMHGRALWLLNGNTMFKDAIRQAEDIMRDPDTQYEIVAGERRWRAAGPKYAGLKKVLVTVRCLTDEQVIEAQYVENLQRRDLTAIEEAEGFATLIKLGKFTADSLAAKLGKSRTYVFERLKITRLEGPARKALEEGRITPSIAAAIAQVPGKKAQEEILEECFEWEGGLRPVREVEQIIQQSHMRPLKGVAWNLDQPMNVPGFGSMLCDSCFHNTRNMISEDPNLAKGPARCMNLDCFDGKAKIALEYRRKMAEKDGLEFWDLSRLQRNSGSDNFWIEGRTVYLPGDSKGKKAEVLANGAKHPIIAESSEGKMLRVWRRSDLEKAGVVKVAAEETISAKREARKEEIFEDKLFLKVKELAIKAMEEKIRGQGMFGADIAKKAPDALLRDYFWWAMLASWERDEGERGFIYGDDCVKFKDITPERIFTEMARKIISNWDDSKKRPACLSALEIHYTALEDQARQQCDP
jgi:ParB/RepB/Spo0J family partition protein